MLVLMPHLLTASQPSMSKVYFSALVQTSVLGDAVLLESTLSEEDAGFRILPSKCSGLRKQNV